MRTALYARISQDDLGEGRGVARQLEDARALAESRGWEVTAEFVDNDVSAFNGAVRDGYQQLMAAVRAKQLDRIVCYQSSRLWRSRRERAEAIEALAASKVSVAAVRGPELDLASASGRMVAGILGEFDTAESEVKSERVTRAALQRAQEGRANGAVAYGWQREHDVDASGRVVGFRDVENPDEAEVVREIVDRLLSGDTIRGIAEDLHSRGVPVPSRREDVRWRHGTVRKLALRPANVGLRVYKGEVIGAAAWPPIVERDRHDRVVALLSSPRRTTSRDASRRHLLSYGIGACGVCGSVLRVARVKRSGRTHVLYTCEEKGCVGRNVERVDEFIGAVVAERLSRPDAAAVFATDDADAKAATERVEALRARLDTAADEYAAGTIDARQMTRITERLRPEITRAEEQARQARAGTDLGAIDPDLLGDKAADVWDALDVNRRRLVLQVLGVTVRILPTRQGPGFDPESVAVGWSA